MLDTLQENELTGMFAVLLTIILTLQNLEMRLFSWFPGSWKLAKKRDQVFHFYISSMMYITDSIAGTQWIHVKLSAGRLTGDFFKQCQSRVCSPPALEIHAAFFFFLLSFFLNTNPYESFWISIFGGNRESKISIKFPSNFLAHYCFGNHWSRRYGAHV